MLALYLFVASTACVSPGPADPEGPTPQLVAYNRYSILGVADQGTQWLHPQPKIKSKINGARPLDEREDRVAYRFSMPASFDVARSVDALWLYYRSVGEPGICSVSLRELDARTGKPSGMSTPAVPFLPQPAAATASWHRVALPQSFDVTPGAVYRIEVQPEENPLDAANHIELVHLRARMPVPFLPYDRRDPAGSLRTPYDAELGSWTDDQRDCGFERWQGPERNYVPIFLVEHDVDRDPTQFTQPELIGQPYDTHIEQTVADTAMFGQAFSVPPGGQLEVNYLAMFVRGAGQSGLPNCQTSPAPCNSRPCGDLLIELYEDGVPQPLASKVLIAGQLAGGTNPVYRARSHWFGAYLDQPLTLEADQLYYLMLSSPQSGDEETLACHDAGGDGWDGWVFSAQSSSLQHAQLAANDLPTYRSTSSYAVRATLKPTGAEDFIPLDSFRSDAGFLLGNFPQQRPLAILDEGTGSALVCQTFSTRATAGEPVRYIAANRNIGTPAAHGQLFARVTDGSTVLDTVYYAATSPNQESGTATTSPVATLELEMPDTPNARLTLEFGWVDPTLPFPANHLVDDRIPADIHRTACCICSQKTGTCGYPGSFEIQKP